MLVNGSPVFDASYLFGFLSLINPDVVEDVRLFKGGVPLKYGELSLSYSSYSCRLTDYASGKAPKLII